MKKAACRGIHPRDHEGSDPFFPERNGSRASERAKIICMGCPVFKECRDYRNKLDPEYGIWAGEHRAKW